MKWRELCGLFVLAGLLILPLQANAFYVSSGFTQQAQYGITPQIFPIGDVVDVNALEQGEDWDFGDIPPIMYIQISGITDAERDDDYVLYVYLEVAGHGRIIEYASRPFALGQWADNVPGGRLYNNQWSNDLAFMRRDGDHSQTASPAEFADLIDGLNLAASVYMLGVELRPGDFNGMVSPDGHYLATIQVYNPSRPIPMNPVPYDDITSPTVEFNWTWTGAPVSPDQVMLYIVEFQPGQENMDPMDVILQRSQDASQTKFAGHPQTYDHHFFLGTGMGESPLIRGRRYAWMVEMQAPTVIPGGFRTFRSAPGEFTFVGMGGSGHRAAGNEPGMDPMMNQLLDILSNKLSPEQYAYIVNQLSGYSPSTISFGGVSGRSISELTNLMLGAGFDVENVIIAE